MIWAFFQVASRSPGRRSSLCSLLAAHFVIASAAAWAAAAREPSEARALLGNVLLTTGIVEGALLLGWRLTQLPKSQALEFLLVSELRPQQILFGEAMVGLARLALATLAGTPALLYLARGGLLEAGDLVALVAIPYTWAAVTGVGLTVWAYEPRKVRKWCERLMIAAIIFYLAVGVLAGENLRGWLTRFPDPVADGFLFCFQAAHRYNPFGVIRAWSETGCAPTLVEAFALALVGTLLAGALLVRAAARLKGHFHELHYQPRVERVRRGEAHIRNRPLAWWAVKRVTQYSGRINLYIAGGFGVLYAVYTLAGPHWPPWLGRQVFILFERMGGVPVLATALVLLAAVPAAFQYGLWDPSVQDRCRRLELLLLTRLRGRDYWEAAAAAAWRRGRGYFAVAVLLWVAATLAGQIDVLHMMGAVAAGVLLWAFYFALGFRAFSRGVQANGLGLLLTLGLPLVTAGLSTWGRPELAALLPPGMVHAASAGGRESTWLLGMFGVGGATLFLSRAALRRCVAELRSWYNANHGSKVLQ
jgi:hypothetical protein